ncbi:MAG: hypothetical protein H7068_12175 [Pedobacter sp.]|nr:hypothetical protein [Chitinophagaceae bacterium]
MIRVEIFDEFPYSTSVQQPVNGANLLSEVLGILPGGVINNSGGKLIVASNATAEV